jgi:hypothetical protein
VDLRYRVPVYLDYCLISSFGHAETLYYTPDFRIIYHTRYAPAHEPCRLPCMTLRQFTTSYYNAGIDTITFAMFTSCRPFLTTITL